jgi:coenzyme F420 hydrogenase subunit beta
MEQIFGSRELLEAVFKKDLCIGCGACVELCPYFKTYKGKTAMLFPCTLSRGQCFAFCPKAEVDLDFLATRFWKAPYEGTPLGKYRKVLMTRAGKKMQKAAFQAGGTVSALMTLALKEGLIDAAALTDRDDMVAVPRLITRAEDVSRCAGSKFMAAPTLSVVNQGVIQGYKRMGVVGTPCQLTAVAQMKTNPLNREGYKDSVILTVGLFCTWAVDTRKLLHLLTECIGDACIQGMDMPPPPSEIMVVDTADGRVEIPLERIRTLVPKGCHVCPDMTSEWGDVSVGVLEGKPDWNTLIIRTQTGDQLVKDACNQGYLKTKPLPAENFKQLCMAAADKKKRALIRARDEGLLNTTAKDRHSVLRFRSEVVQRIIERDTEERCQTS